MKKYLVFLIPFSAIFSIRGYVKLPPPDNITTFMLDTSKSNAGDKNLRYCLYDAGRQIAQCLPDVQQNIMIYQRSNLIETTSDVPPKRTPGDTAVLVGTFLRQMPDPEAPGRLKPVTFYVWKMRYENPM